MTAIYLRYRGYDKKLDEQVETAIVELGGEWTGAGYGFGDIRTINFEIPDEKVDAAKKVLDGMGGIKYDVIP